jgi:RNA polymerase subunit RPABC4/transcription elongation factor Spt4
MSRPEPADIQCPYCHRSKPRDLMAVVDGRGLTITICVNCKRDIHYEDHEWCNPCNQWIHFEDTIENPPYSTYFECKWGHPLTGDNRR